MAFADYMNETEMVDSYKSLDRDPGIPINAVFITID